MVNKRAERDFIDKIKLDYYTDKQIIKKAYPKPLCYKNVHVAHDMWTGEKCEPDSSKYKIIKTAKRSFRDRTDYVAVFEAHKGYQFIRWFNIYMEGKVGQRANIFAEETMQYIIAPDNNIYFKRENVATMSYNKYFIYNTELKYRKVEVQLYEFGTTAIIKKSFVDRFKKVHITKYICGFIIEYLNKILSGDSRYETLVESHLGHFALRSLNHYGNCNINKMWIPIKIALRNNYKFRNYAQMNMWLDEMTLVEELGLDIHNAKYVCPKNLRKAHVLHSNQLDNREKKLAKERDLERAVANNEKYIKAHKKYLNNTLETKDFIIRPLQSTIEFYEEAQYMHHCLFSAGYYKKDNSLILTVRDKNNKRIETCEVHIHEREINQCYGKFDKYTDYHNRILKTINSNLNVLLR